MNNAFLKRKNCRAVPCHQLSRLGLSFVSSLFCFVAFAHEGNWSAHNGEYRGCFEFTFENIRVSGGVGNVIWADDGKKMLFTGPLSSSRSWRSACASALGALPPTSAHENIVETYSMYRYDPVQDYIGSCTADVRLKRGWYPTDEHEYNERIEYHWTHTHIEPQYPDLPADTFVEVDGGLYYRTYYCEEFFIPEMPGSDEPQQCDF